MIDYLFLIIIVSYLFSIFLLSVIYILTGIDTPPEGCMYILIACIARSLICYPKSKHDQKFKEKK